MGKDRLETHRSAMAKQARRPARAQRSRPADAAALLSRAVHDDIGQRLTFVKLGLESLLFMTRGRQNTGAVAARITDLIRETDAGIATARALGLNLRKAGMQDGLPDALRPLVAAFRRHTGIRCRLRIAGRVSVTEDCAASLLAIAREGLTNIALHSGARSASIELAAKGSSIVLSISDRGCGIEPQKLFSPDSLGLRGISERAVLFGGRARFGAVRPHGASVVVEIPVPAEMTDVKSAHH
jgi:signal transduction histidine kinase